MLYNSYKWRDVAEPMAHVYHNFGYDRKCFALGLSMGANILANMLGHLGDECFLDGACAVAAPIKKWES